MHQNPADAVLSAIAGSGNDATQGWMRLMSSAPWFGDLHKSGEKLAPLQADYLDKQTRLWTGLVAGKRERIAETADVDRRFLAKEWRENAYYDYLRQSYLLVSRYLEQLVDAAEIDAAAKERVRFAVKQWIDAMCPANFAATNPAVLAEAIASRGESVTRGLANLLADTRKGRLSQTDEAAFEVGRNLALTPGDVVFENELMQLIQYRPTTKQVAERPLVMVPPCINKFYILDLQPENSFVAHAVAQGNTVFMVSWRNVGPEQGHLTWDDYLEKGVHAALRVGREISGADAVNALGFCVGGTLLGAFLGKENPDWVASVTLLATMLDFEDTGQIGLFVDPASVAAREMAIGKGGVFPGGELAFVFSSLRANDLVWPYVVNNYLLGGRPAAFDLLYWNADSTNLPGPMYCQYLRNTYLENRLKEQHDFGRVRAPLFVVATREDHIVPWRTAYRSLELFSGSEAQTFVLGASGHIAGIVNPPDKKRRSHWLFERLPADPEQALAAATEEKGSWWPRWSDWLAQYAGGRRPAPGKPGNKSYKPVEPAPGRYVRQRAH